MVLFLAYIKKLPSLNLAEGSN